MIVHTIDPKANAVVKASNDYAFDSDKAQ